MLHTKCFLNNATRLLVFKQGYNRFVKLPEFLAGELILWINLQQYKKLRILIFIFLTIFCTGHSIFILKKQTKVFFYISIDLRFIFNLLDTYLSNVDISVNKLLAYKGKKSLVIFLSYNKFPLLPELDEFFEHVASLLTFIDDNVLGLRFYIDTISLIEAETRLRIFNLPILLVNTR